MLSERLKGLIRTLRFRLMVWNTTVLLLLVLLILAGAREGVRWALLHEMDQLLNEDMQEIRLALLSRQLPETPLREELDLKARSHSGHGWFAQIFTANKALIWQSPNTPALETVPEGRHTVHTSAGPVRLVQNRIKQPNGQILIVRVGTSLQPLQEDVGLITEMALLALGMVLLLAPLGGFWLSGRATQPLANIIQTTASLRPDNMHERLPLRQTGDELDQLAMTINGFLDRIATDMNRKRDFLANAAHELRSPLAAIRGTAEIALSHERTPEEYMAFLGDVIEECSHLTGLVNRLLLLAARDADQLALREQSVALDEVVRKSLQMFEGVAEVQGVKLCSGLIQSATVPGDEYHLRQVVNNLIDNALKFTPEGGMVQVSLDTDPREGTARLQVQDTGCGIGTTELPRIFERFYRGDKSRQHARGRRGDGLGLSICQAIVTALDGTLEAQSQLGKGSTFTTILPLRSGSTGDHRHPPSGVRDGNDSRARVHGQKEDGR